MATRFRVILSKADSKDKHVPFVCVGYLTDSEGAGSYNQGSQFKNLKVFTSSPILERIIMDAAAGEAGTSGTPGTLANLWERLPQDLVECVLPWLPITTILQSRTISKQIRSWLTSRSFMDEYARVPSRFSWLMVFPDSKSSVACAYDPYLDTWLEIPHSFFPLRPLASSRGLVCMIPRPEMSSSSSDHHQQLLVCNPVTRSYVGIPRPLELSKFFFLVVGMLCTDQSNFKIIVAGSELVSGESGIFRISATVFDSRRWSWQKGASMLLDAPISPSKAVSNSGKLFVVAGRRELAAYDVEQGCWSRIHLPVSGLSGIRLLNNSGNLVLVARSTTDICIWQLQSGDGSSGSSSLWKKLNTMPACFQDKLLQSSSKRFACIGAADYAYFSSTTCPRVLVYRFSSKSWSWASSCRSFNISPLCDMLRGTCIEPRLDTNPCYPH